MIFRPLIICLALLIAPAAHARVIYSDDFEDGLGDRWVGDAGRGVVELSTYQGNTSLRLTRNALAITVVRIAGFENIRAGVSFAANDLEGEDACLLESSLDGENWHELGRVGDGHDDGVSLYGISGGVPEVVGAPHVFLRLRVAGNANNDTCWADNLRVTGDAPLGHLQSSFSVDQLTGAAALPGFVQTSAFAPSSRALPPSRTFEGRLQFITQSNDTQMDVFEDRFEFLGIANTENDVLPAFDFAFVQVGDRLVPAARGAQRSDHPFWEFVLTPGRVWDEPGEAGWTRAAIPFAITEKNANCTHNGLLTFLFGDDGTVSRVAYQIGSETCLYFKFDAHGSADATYTPGPVTGADAIASSFEAERTARLPTRRFAALADDHPGMDAGAFGHPDDVSPEFMSAFGLVYGGIHYVSDCPTRFGPYPYCDEMALPSYSFAKSLFAGLALMRLEQLYPGAMDAMISDYVPECVEGWEGITFEHALDMATGNYISTASEADENAAVDARFFLTETHSEKIALACTRYPHQADPGTQWVYHTTDTYILGTAMRAFWRQHYGADADMYAELLYEPVFAGLGLSPTISETRRTYDDIAQPFTGWGLFMQRGDLALLAEFLNEGTGVINGEQALAADELTAALQRAPEDRGLPAPDDMYRYNNGFWAWNFGAYTGCTSDVWVPFMSGFGGLSAVFSPAGATYYYFSDGGEYRWARAVRATEQLAPFCTRTN